MHEDIMGILRMTLTLNNFPVASPKWTLIHFVYLWADIEFVVHIISLMLRYNAWVMV